MSKMILIAGYYGFGNMGDEAILSSILEDLRGIYSNPDIVVVSGDSQKTECVHCVKAVPWNGVGEITNAMRECDAVIIGGGGIFHDYWGFDETKVLTPEHIGIPFFTSISLLASIFNKPLMLYAVGVGPLKSDIGKHYVRAIIEQADIITVRDEESKQELINLGETRDCLYVAADPVFRLPVKSDQVGNKALKNLILGVALRNWDVGISPDLWEQEVANAIDKFLDFHPTADVLFIPFQDSREKLLNDQGCAERVRGKMRNAKLTKNVNASCRLEEKIVALEQCDLVLGMRLHALILAACRGIPMIGLAYDPKIKRLMEQIGMGKYVLGLGNLSSSSLCQLLEEELQQRDHLSVDVEIASSLLADKAFQSVRLVEKMLAEMPPKYSNLTPSAQRVLMKAATSLSEINEQSLMKEEKQSNQIEQLHVEKTGLQKTIERKEQEYNRTISELKEQVRGYCQQVETLEERNAIEGREIAGLTTQLAEIKESRGWKFIWVLWQIRLFFFPHGSQRERILVAILRGIAGLLRQPFRIIKRVFNRGVMGYSLYADVFLRNKQKRQEMFVSDLQGLKPRGENNLVSIVLPVYNGEAYLAEALDSILAQTYQHFEVIAVNDGSVDKTKEILDKYARQDNRIQVIHQENRKLPAALNRGFRLAKGEYLTWTSDDNRLKPEFLEKMVDCLTRHPAWDMVYANVDMIDSDGFPLCQSSWYGGYQNPVGSGHVYLPADTAELNIWPNNYIGGAFLYRNRVKDLIGEYSLHQFTLEDYDYWMRINALMMLRHVDFSEPVYEYRFHEDTLTSRDDELGITRNRKKLMVFDDFRRDFYTTPLAWFIDDADLAGIDIGGELSEGVLRNGDCALNTSYSHNVPLPNLWFPCVYLKATSNPMSSLALPAGLPSSTISVLLCVTKEQLPEEGDPGWQMRLALGGQYIEAKHTGKDHQGWWISEDLNVLRHAIDIYVRSHHLKLLEDEIARAPQRECKVTVIICTYQRNQGLRDALLSVANQSLSQTEYEVLVIDNNPSGPESASVVDEIRAKAFTDCPENLKLVHCPVAGLSFARNAGIAEASSDILLFMDDDATASEYLLEQYWNAFSQHPNAGVIGGHIVLDRPEQFSMIWKDGWERYWSQFITAHDGYTEVKNWWEFPWGANWAANRKALMRVGGFRGKYGRRGNDFNGGEEIIAASLIQRLGYTVAILPKAEVEHHVEEKRFTLEHLKQTIRAAMFVQYESQMDLYIPLDFYTGGRIWHHVTKLATLVFRSNDTEDKASLYETRFKLSARWQLLKYQASRHFQRKKRHRIWKKTL
jgi:polysaccharide pyruvyl transferase CsaB